jgi:hypothetical protein
MVVSDSVDTHMEVTLWGESVNLVTSLRLLARIGYYIDIMYVMPRWDNMNNRMILHSTGQTRIAYLSNDADRGKRLTTQLNRQPLLCSQVSVTFTQMSHIAPAIGGRHQLVPLLLPSVPGIDKDNINRDDEEAKRVHSSTLPPVSLPSISALLSADRSGRYRLNARVIDITFPALTGRPLPPLSSSLLSSTSVVNGITSTISPTEWPSISWRYMHRRDQNDWDALVYRGCARCMRPISSFNDDLDNNKNDGDDDERKKEVVSKGTEVLMCRYCPLLEKVATSSMILRHSSVCV